MVLSHVPQRSRVIVIPAALFHPDGFTERNLHVCDMFVVPERLKKRIRKTDDFDILNHFLPEVMVDAINFLFLKYLTDLLIQLFGRLQIVSERFFDHEASPSRTVQHAAFLQVGRNASEQLRCQGQIKQAVPRNMVAFLQSDRLVVQLAEAVHIVDVQGLVLKMLRKGAELVVIFRFVRKIPGWSETRPRGIPLGCAAKRATPMTAKSSANLPSRYKL